MRPINSQRGKQEPSLLATILHVDMDAFFASIEQRDNPDLRNRPVVVGGSPETRGVVAAASYEARRFGIKSAMPMATAVRLCPGLHIISARHGKYKAVSEQLMAILRKYTPLVEPVSLDEAYLDVTGCTRLFGEPADIAGEIQRRISGELLLSASVGVGPNKLIAKLASDYRKPQGLTVVSGDDVEAFLVGMPVEKVWGLGPQTCAELKKIGISTLGRLRSLSLEYLVNRFGKNGRVLYDLARGLDGRSVTPERAVKSLGKEVTFPKDMTDSSSVENTVRELAEAVSYRLRKRGMLCCSVTLKLKHADLRLITRTGSLPDPTNLAGPVRETAVRLLRENWQGYPPLRLAGVTCGKLLPGEGLAPSLFPQPRLEKEEKITRATDQLKERFGHQVVKSAVFFQGKID